jgi:uncharacterized protein (DUF58 family)
VSGDESRKRIGRGRLTLTNEGMFWLAATFVLGGVGWLKSINLVLILAYMMAALLILNGVLARMQVRRVAAARTASLPVYAGESATVRVTATNTGRGRATVSVADRAGATAIGWLVHRLPPGHMVSCAAPRVFTTRGVHKSSLRVSSEFPLGLLHYDQPAEPESELFVLPAPGIADALALRHWLLRQAGGDGRARKVLRRVTIDQADVRGVRPYRPGDPIRGIHWRSSARRGELMVREYDAAPSPELVLVVEPWLPKEPTEVDEANVESALSLAVTIARSWSRSFGTRVTIAVAGDPASVRTAWGTESAIREALAPLAAVTGGRGFQPLGPKCFDRALQRAARLVVSSRRNSPYAAALARSTGRPFMALSPSSRPAWYQPPLRGQTTSH